MEDIRDRIKMLREALGLSQAELGERLHLERSVVSRIEHKQRNATDRFIADISREFNVNENWLRNGEGEMFVKIDRNDRLMQWAGTVLADESDSFRRRFIEMLSTLNDQEWEWMADKAKMLCEQEKDSSN